MGYIVDMFFGKRHLHPQVVLGGRRRAVAVVHGNGRWSVLVDFVFEFGEKFDCVEKEKISEYGHDGKREKERHVLHRKPMVFNYNKCSFEGGERLEMEDGGRGLSCEV